MKAPGKKVRVLGIPVHLCLRDERIFLEQQQIERTKPPLVSEELCPGNEVAKIEAGGSR